jgi:hypothetical protein
MAELASRLLVLTVVAFCLWVVLLRALRRVSPPISGIVAALVSWGGASVAAGWIVAILRRTGYWPLV